MPAYPKSPPAHKSSRDVVPMPAAVEAELLLKITKAVTAVNEAEQTVTTARAELVSRSKAVGLLLLEAKKLHPAVEDFKAFLEKVHGLGLSRAYDCMRIAGGRTTDEEIRKETRDRVKKHRATKELSRPAPKKPEPPNLSVTDRHVTETAEANAERRKAENADLDLTAEEKTAKSSAHNLAEFIYACKAYLPKLTKADLEKARVFFIEGTWKPKATAEAA